MNMRKHTGRGNVSINGAEFAVDLQAIFWISPFLLIFLIFLVNFGHRGIAQFHAPDRVADLLPISYSNRPVSAWCHTAISF